MAASEILIVLPKLTESFVEGQIVEWCVAEGEYVERDTPLMVVAGGTAPVEFPSPHSGTLTNQLAAAGDMVAAIAPVAVIRLNEADDSAAGERTADTGGPAADEAANSTVTIAPAPAAGGDDNTGGDSPEDAAAPPPNVDDRIDDRDHDPAVDTENGVGDDAAESSDSASGRNAEAGIGDNDDDRTDTDDNTEGQADEPGAVPAPAGDASEDPDTMTGSEIEIVLPELAESVVEGEVLEWHVAEGAYVERDAPLLDVASDKANVELPSPHSGTLTKQLANVGDMVPVGTPIARIRVDDTAGAGADERPAASDDTAAAPAPTVDDEDEGRSLFSADDSSEPVHNPFAESGATEADTAAGLAEHSSAGTNRHGRVLATPSARILARDLGVDIAAVSGSGPNGRVSRDDVRNHADADAAGRRTTAPVSAPADDAHGGEMPPPVAYHTPAGYENREQREPLHGMRRAIARQMSASHLYAVRTLVVDEADLSRLVNLRTQLKAGAEDRGVHLSYLPFIFKALVWVLKEYPQLNTSLDEATHEIVHKSYYNIGLAVATEAGLVVPVVRDADTKSILELATDINHYANRARAGELTADEMHGASFSVTNVGAIGSLFSFPIINSPDAAILGVHAIKDRPVAVRGEVVIRPMIYLSLAFDHRLVDGATAAQFLRDIIMRLENPDDWLLAAV